MCTVRRGRTRRVTVKPDGEPEPSNIELLKLLEPVSSPATVHHDNTTGEDDVAQDVDAFAVDARLQDG